MRDKISICIAKVNSNAPKDYLKKRIRLVYKANAAHSGGLVKVPHYIKINKLAAGFQKVMSKRRQPKLAPPFDVSTLDGDERAYRKYHKTYNIHYACMIRNIESQFPPIKGEKVINDFASYLEEPWNGYPANSITLKRETNYSTTYYVFKNIRANVEKLQINLHGLVSTTTTLASYAGSQEPEPNFGGAALSLATGLAGLAPPPRNVIATAFITLLWPSQDSSAQMWKQVYEALQRIIKTALAQNEVDVASAKAQSIILYLNNTYDSLKAAGKSPEELYNSLEPYNKEIVTEIMSILMFLPTTDDFPDELATSCLANFMLAAGLHLGVLQELALQDEPDDPTSSGWAASVSKYAKDYADYADERAEYVKQLRLNQISEVLKGTETSCDATTGDCWNSTVYYFIDSNVPYTSDKHEESSKYDAKGAVEDDRTLYYTDISKDMDEVLKEQIYDVTALWRILENDPLPEPGN